MTRPTIFNLLSNTFFNTSFQFGDVRTLGTYLNKIQVITVDIFGQFEIDNNYVPVDVGMADAMFIDFYYLPSGHVGNMKKCLI